MSGKDLYLKLVDEIILLLSYNNLVKYTYLFVWSCASGFYFIIKVKENKVKQKTVHSHFIVWSSKKVVEAIKCVMFAKYDIFCILYPNYLFSFSDNLWCFKHIHSTFKTIYFCSYDTAGNVPGVWGMTISKAEREYSLSLWSISHNSSWWHFFPLPIFLPYKEKGVIILPELLLTSYCLMVLEC